VHDGVPLPLGLFYLCFFLQLIFFIVLGEKEKQFGEVKK
jgi:hypothetical protein